MQGYGAPMNYPRTAYLLALIGGIFILLDAIVSAALVAAVGAVVGSILPGFGILLIVFAVIVLLFGLIILFLSLRLKSNPQTARMTGILIIVFSLLSFLSGGGFVIGGILALIGGILAVVWTPPAMMAQPGWGQPGAGQWGQPGQPAQPGWGQPAPPPASSGKVCASCGTANAVGAQFCAKCGAALPP